MLEIYVQFIEFIFDTKRLKRGLILHKTLEYSCPLP